MLAENPILWCPGEQVKMANDVEAAKGAMIFGQQMIDKTFGSRSVDVLHDVRAGSRRAPTTLTSDFPAW